MFLRSITIFRFNITLTQLFLINSLFWNKWWFIWGIIANKSSGNKTNVRGLDRFMCVRWFKSMNYCPYWHEISPTTPGKITTCLAMKPNTRKLANLSLFVLNFSITIPLCSTGRMFGYVRNINGISRVQSKVQFSHLEPGLRSLEKLHVASAVQLFLKKKRE